MIASSRSAAERRYSTSASLPPMQGMQQASTSFPDHGDEDLLATLRLIAGSPDESIGALFEQIPKRHTYPKEFVAEEVGEETQEALTAAAVGEGATLHFLDGGVRRDTAALIAEGDRMLFADRC
jgi:uncharacterized protein (DUF885 family)